MVDIKSEIRNFFLENFLFGNSEKLPDDDDSFLQKGLIDSTGILEVVNFVEEKFGISVEDDELIPGNFDSIRRLSVFIALKRGLNV